MISKLTQRTRDAYAADLRNFAEFLSLSTDTEHHPLATIPDQNWRQLDTT